MIKVVCALIKKEDKVLIAKRATGDINVYGKWEFPGGKVEINETEESAIEREIKEEFEIEIKAKKFITNNICKYPKKVIDLRLYECDYISGDIKLNDHLEYKWVRINELLNYDLAEADIVLANYLRIEMIKTPEDILEFMKQNIKYGWLDINGEKHIGNMKNFRRLYRTSSLEETLKNKIGTCIEQVYLMNYLLNKINIPTKMFCTRIYEGENFNNLEEEEHMHCFVLYYLNNKVYHIEHPNWEKIGIYEYKNEETALNTINEYYIKMANGKSRPIKHYSEVEPGLSFKEFNCYINSLDTQKRL